MYVWLGLVDLSYVLDRPGYLWILAIWTPIEASLIGRGLWRLGAERVTAETVGPRDERIPSGSR